MQPKSKTASAPDARAALNQGDDWDAEIASITGVSRLDPAAKPSQRLPLVWGGIYGFRKQFWERTIRLERSRARAPALNDEATPPALPDEITVANLVELLFAREMCDPANPNERWPIAYRSDPFSDSEIVTGNVAYTVMAPRDVGGILHAFGLCSARRTVPTTIDRNVRFVFVDFIRTPVELDLSGGGLFQFFVLRTFPEPVVLEFEMGDGDAALGRWLVADVMTSARQKGANVGFGHEADTLLQLRMFLNETTTGRLIAEAHRLSFADTLGVHADTLKDYAVAPEFLFDFHIKNRLNQQQLNRQSLTQALLAVCVLLCLLVLWRVW